MLLLWESSSPALTLLPHLDPPQARAQVDKLQDLQPQVAALFREETYGMGSWPSSRRKYFKSVLLKIKTIKFSSKNRRKIYCHFVIKRLIKHFAVVNSNCQY